MSYLVAGLIFVTVLALIAGRKPVQRVLSAIGAQLNMWSRMIWSANPVAMYQKEVDKATEELKEGARGLEQYQAIVSQFERRMKDDEAEIAVLDARARDAVSRGDDAKATTALSMKNRLVESLKSTRDQLAKHRESYNANLKKTQFAKKKIEEARMNASVLSAELKMSVADRELSALAQSFNTPNSLTQLGEAEEEIRRQIDVNRAKAKVANDLGYDGMADIEADERIQAAATADDLAKLKAEMNVAK